MRSAPYPPLTLLTLVSNVLHQLNVVAYRQLSLAQLQNGARTRCDPYLCGLPEFAMRSTV